MPSWEPSGSAMSGSRKQALRSSALAILLAVGCFPPLLRDYTQRPLTA